MQTAKFAAEISVFDLPSQSTDVCGRACTRPLGFQPPGLFTRPPIAPPYPPPSSDIAQCRSRNPMPDVASGCEGVECTAPTYVQKHDSQSAMLSSAWQVETSRSCNRHESPRQEGPATQSWMLSLARSGANSAVTIPTVPCLSSNNSLDSRCLEATFSGAATH